MPERAAVEAPAAAPPASPRLSALIDDWIAEKSRSAWVPKTAQEHRVWINHFIALVGDRPLSAYGKADARAFKTLLMHLPANSSKLKPLQGLSMQDAAAKARELGLPPMANANVNKVLGRVAGFWTWAADHFDDCPENPFKGLQISAGKHRTKDERDPFSLDDLQVIFNAPLYAGCASLREWSSAGTLVPRDAGVFWVPLIGLFSGMRLGEIAQLYVEDVKEDQGVPYFDVTDAGPDQRLKTAHSRRTIPVHQTLIRIGFMDFVKRQRQAGRQRLFPDIRMGSDGYYSSMFSKHFARFLKSVGVKSKKNAFHSLRHNVEDAYREARVPKDVMDALQGHAEQGMSGRYGDGFTLGRLNEALQKVRYEALDLGHLIGE